MRDAALAQVVLGALALIMLGMGLSLTPADFRRVAAYPRAVGLGLLNQLLLLPLLGLLLVTLFPLDPMLALGVMVLAACPGGPGSNLFTHLAKGDTALSVTLTACSGMACVITTPLIINASAAHLVGSEAAVALPFLPTVAQLFGVALAPVLIGMAVRARAPRFATRMERKVKIGSGAFLAFLTVGSIMKERAHLPAYLGQVGAVVLLLNLVGMACGYFSGRLAGLGPPQRVCLALETGIQNIAVGIAIAVSPSLLGRPEAAIPAAAYTVIMLPAAGSFVLLSAWRARRASSAAPGSGLAAPAGPGS